MERSLRAEPGVRRLILGIGVLPVALLAAGSMHGFDAATHGQRWVKANGKMQFAAFGMSALLTTLALALFAVLTSSQFVRFEARRPRAGFWTRHVLQGVFLCAAGAAVLVLIGAGVA